MVNKPNLDEICRSKAQTTNQTDTNLFPNNLEEILECYFAEAHGTNDRYACLTTGVTAGVHKHRNECGEDCHCRQFVLKACDNRPCECCRNHKEQQPRKAGFPSFKNRGFKVCFLRREHSVHLLNILVVFLLDDINSVIDRDDTNQTAFHINNGKCKEVILIKQLSCKFLVIKRV